MRQYQITHLDALAVPTPSPATIARIEALERSTLAEDNKINVPVTHGFGAGCYSRTVRVRAGLFITGAKMKTPTQIIVSGKCLVNLGDEYVTIEGYAVLAGAAGRKQLFVALEDTYITMFFASGARTAEEAEREFTDQAEELNSRMPGAVNEVVS
jgi:hypothetical protein